LENAETSRCRGNEVWLLRTMLVEFLLANAETSRCGGNEVWLNKFPTQ
jgi:hypothetical protein